MRPSAYAVLRRILDIGDSVESVVDVVGDHWIARATGDRKVRRNLLVRNCNIAGPAPVQVFRGRVEIGSVDLEATEQALREMGQRVGGGLLEKLLNAGGGIEKTNVVCSQGHRARFIDSREKDVVTVVGTVKLGRGYYYCAVCGQGVIPEDRELDIEDTKLPFEIRPVNWNRLRAHSSKH